MSFLAVAEFYYISKIVRALWLVNLAGRAFLHGPLKFEVFLLPNCRVIYHQIFSTYEANNSLKLSFTLNCVLKRANDLNPFQIDSFSFDLVQKFEAMNEKSWMEIVPEPVRDTIEK